MAKRRKLGYALCIVLVWALPVRGQVLPTPTVEPLPLPGGDVLRLGARDPALPDGTHGSGPNSTAMGYTNGMATDNANNAYQVITDIRVYQGDYIGAQATFGAGGSTSAKAHGTFVEI